MKVEIQFFFYVSKIGPYLNPSETYRSSYRSTNLTDHVKDKKESLGLALNGDHLVSAPYKLDFLVGKQCQVLCRKNLTKEDIFRFQTAIAEEYVYQMYRDDFPLWAFVGIVNRDRQQFLITHIQFKIYYNGDRVIEIRTQPDLSHMVELTEEKDIDVEFEFLYSVEWKETATLFEKRMEKYKKPADFVHWLSIMISFILTIYLVSLGGRMLRREFSKQGGRSSEVMCFDASQKYKSFFSAALGSGIQLLTMLVPPEMHLINSDKPFKSYQSFNAFLAYSIHMIKELSGMHLSLHVQRNGSSVPHSMPLSFVKFCVLPSVGMTIARLLGNHEWWWRSFLYGGSVGIYVYGFSLYYYFQDSEMSGFLQTSFFFGYMACICYGLFLMLGTVGFYASLCFVRYVYGSIIKKT
ncbi:unnamed protein product [Coffea canephora]|uniref:Transmembrane 9 superfamily member n=1 Tax=Coffea canephora TaxID=49390 RepID=A0A068UAY1_COFCA|nr:unnamed protein product [Coffea canephora]